MHSSTKMTFVALNFVSLFIFNVSIAQTKPTHFKGEADFGNGNVFSTFLDADFSQDQFSIQSPKDADLRVMGEKAKLGRLFGKLPKDGIIISIKGYRTKDSLYGDTDILMVGKLKFKGTIKNENLSGQFFNETGTAVGTLSGTPSAGQKIDYSGLGPVLLKTIQDNIYSAQLLQTTEWTNFQTEVTNLCATAHDDIELYFGFNMFARKLPFSHLSLAIANQIDDDGEASGTAKSVVFEEKNAATAYLHIKNFSNSAAALAATLPGIVANTNYKNLIVDLRDNPGGGIEAGSEFLRHIVDSDMEIGYFPTNKLQYIGYQQELFRTLPGRQPKSTSDFTDELKISPGAKLVFKKPSNPVFKGNLYVLTNGNTASTCEPIVYALKNNNKATIVGEKTGGAMLAASPFTVAGKYTIMLPIADFYTYDGVRLDQVGVSPDIEVKSGEALNKVLEMIANGKN